MMKPTPKTYEEHLDYLHQTVRLKLFFLWHWLKDHPEEPFRQVLQQRVDIYRKTDINPGGVNPKEVHYDDPAWVTLAQNLEAVYRECADDPGPDVFEEEGFALCEPTVTARSRRDFEARPYVLDYRCGSLNYDTELKWRPETLLFHIANALTPRSFFDEPLHIPHCLLCVMEKGGAASGWTKVGTGTWLNSLPRWLEYFPAQWQENMGPPDTNVLWHFGFWGQFLSARGTFNRKLGDAMRQTGQLPYLPRTAWCTFDELRTHLRERYGV